MSDLKFQKRPMILKKLNQIKPNETPMDLRYQIDDLRAAGAGDGCGGFARSNTGDGPAGRPPSPRLRRDRQTRAPGAGQKTSKSDRIQVNPTKSNLKNYARTTERPTAMAVKI
jgi:hypothetical protein